MTRGATDSVLYVERDLGRIFIPQALARGTSYAGRPVRQLLPGEVGIFVAKQQRAVYLDGHMHDDKCNVLTCEWKQLEAAGVPNLIKRMEVLWTSITHNERVRVGAAIQANRVFGTTGTTANGVFTAVAVATTGFTTKTDTDLSIGVITAAATTNEFTASGLARAAGTVGTYTQPASLGAQFSQVITRTNTATAGATAHGGAIFDQVAVAASNMYVEDTFASDAILANGDTLTIQVTISN